VLAGVLASGPMAGRASGQREESSRSPVCSPLCSCQVRWLAAQAASARRARARRCARRCARVRSDGWPRKRPARGELAPSGYPRGAIVARRAAERPLGCSAAMHDLQAIPPGREAAGAEAAKRPSRHLGLLREFQ
jgi:hypothetical protein